MEKEDNNNNQFESSISTEEAEMKKARIVSSIIQKAEQGDEEENKGRS
jgi:DNA invertase Pin-like site-specific DNA recombinase